MLMINLLNFSNFYGEDQHLLDFKFPEISQRKLLNLSDNDFREVMKIGKISFQLGVRVNIDPHHLVRLARDDVRRGVQHLLHEEVRAWDGKASVAQSEDEP